VNGRRFALVAVLAVLAVPATAHAGGASPSSVAFGSVSINTTQTTDVTITVDAGYRTELASGGGINAPFSFDFDTCGAGGGFTGPGTCNVKQSFRPTSATASSGTTNVFECPIAGGSCIAIPYSVSGTGVSVASASPSSVPFGNVPINTTQTRDVTITVDSGYRTELASGGGINAPFSFDFDTCGAGGGFAGPGSCNVKQSFRPTSATASSGTTNVFECPIAGGSCIAIPYSVSGTGVSLASASPSSVPFGNVPINTTVTSDVTITVDAGYRTELASGGGINAPFSFDFDTCGAGGGFAGPGGCNVKQSFHPTTASSSSGTTNVFECPIAGGSCIAIPYSVSGTGVSLASASPSSIAFGNVAINTTQTRDVTITVDAGYRTELASGSGINAPFSFDFDTCGAGGGFAGPGSCNVKQSYRPTAASASSGTTNVFECPIAGGSCIAIPYSVSGTGVSLASASPSSVPFGNVPINTTQTRDVSITVDAGYRTELASGSGINAPFTFDFDTCGAGGGFAGPGSCNVKQSFRPTATGAFSGTTNVFECPIAGGTCIAIPYAVSGTGVSGASASPSSVDFGNVSINTTQTRDITITVDAGYRTQLASGSGINAPFSFDFDTCGAGGGFAGPGSCNVKQSFRPTAAGPASATTNVFECPIAGGSCIAIPYSVSGTGISQASASPASVDFGNVPLNTAQTRDVTITVDAGYRTQLASGSGINAPFSFDFDTCGAGGGFAGPGTCNVKQSFRPTSTTASSGTTNVFECPIAGGTCIPIPFSVSGTGVSLASASPSSVAFGNVPINTTQTRDVTITVDAGYRTQLASGSGINAPFSFDFDTCGAGAGFAGPGSCNVKQRYSPTAQTASSGTTNVFECPIAGGSCVAIPYNLSGTGVQAGGASPSSINFGSIALGSSASADVTVTVDAGYRFGGGSGTGTAAPFAFDARTCGTGSGFAGPGTCLVRETYAPTVVGPSSGTLTLSECPIAGGACVPIPVSLTGSGASSAGANPPALNFGNVQVGDSARQNVIITVDRGYRISGGSGSGVSAPFSFELKSCLAFAGPGQCTVRETFAPTSAGGASGTLFVNECPIAGGPCVPIPVSLSGNGVLVATTLDLKSSKNPARPGQAVTFTAKLDLSSGSNPSGTITFMDGATVLGAVAIVSKKATFSTSSLAAGNHTITATYSGDATFAGSSDSLIQTISLSLSRASALRAALRAGAPGS